MHSTRLPQKLLNLITSAQLKQIYHVCLGCEDSFLLTWRDTSGQDRIDVSGLPSDLIEFLYKRDAQRRLVREIPDIRCVLGPYNSSFLAHDGSAYAWLNLPEKLLHALQSRIKDGKWADRPQVVALGADGNFILSTEKNSVIWHLDQYRSVSKYLSSIRERPQEVSKIRQVVLHPYRFQASIIHLQGGGLVADNLPPPAITGFELMKEAALRDTTATRRKPLARQASEGKAPMQRKPSVLQQRAQMRREWSNHSQEFSAQAKGLKVSLSLNISLGGLTRMLG